MAQPNPKVRRTALIAGMLACAGVSIAATPASAQFFGWFDGGPAVEDTIIPPAAVSGILRSEGYRLMAAPVRHGNRIIAVGQDGRGQMMRFVIDGHDGDVIRASLIGPPRPPGYVPGRPAVAWGAPETSPGLFETPDAPPASALPAPPKAKAKPKVTTAARHAPALPKAAPASPAPAPSEAARAPAPVVAPTVPANPPAEARTPNATPAAPVAKAIDPTPTAKIVVPAPVPAPAAKAEPTEPAPAVATRTPEPAPETRPAPDAQPKSSDIGPKVVPVGPTQARIPVYAPAPEPPAEPASSGASADKP
jgi:hypothetical protein